MESKAKLSAVRALIVFLKQSAFPLPFFAALELVDHIRKAEKELGIPAPTHNRESQDHIHRSFLEAGVVLGHLGMDISEISVSVHGDDPRITFPTLDQAKRFLEVHQTSPINSTQTSLAVEPVTGDPCSLQLGFPVFE